MNSLEYFLSYFPEQSANIIASNLKNDLQVDVISSGDDIFYVVSKASSNLLEPYILSEYPHIPYQAEFANMKPPASNEIGVFVFVLEVHDPAQAIRLQFQGDIIELEVRHRKACFFIWDSPWVPQGQLPSVLKLQINGLWQDTFHPYFAATVKTFLNTYKSNYDLKTFNWTWDGNWEAHDSPEARARTRKIIQMFVDQFDGTEPHMGVLAAGAVENSLSHEFLDYVVADLKHKKIWQRLIQGTYFYLEPEDLKERISKFLAT